ncbi:MAG: diaminopimelate epimerase [Bacteroidetes bacterium HGW-Bacteroidetes-2]|jgi:diaminopimelate epimerase|nr:MAG: diaminopimelate epimerase [Bacteroidetes bacterium HGW-Bacteroidetes-2]
MQFSFYKYQGTGNDFVFIDNRSLFFPKKDTKRIAQLCDRKFGIGADGLILLENHTTVDFKMVYFNADGQQSSMCGNGGRCIVHFAKLLHIIALKATFEAIDGMHTATINEDGIVSLKMSDISDIKVYENYSFLNSGSPHHVEVKNDIKSISLQQEGAQLRYGLYGKDGANINFVQEIGKDIFAVRTYERGVEDETLSCGTGATAVAIAMHNKSLTASNSITIETKGGTLKVTFEKIGETYKNIYLIGKATLVFKGEWIC